MTDWRDKSAQPGDRWLPKRGKDGKLLALSHPIKGSISVECGPIEIYQIHNADRAALVIQATGRQALIKWRDLRRHWKPETVREEVNHG